MADTSKVGVDIGSASIKLVELVPAGGERWKLAAAASIPSPAGGINAPGNLTTISQSIVKIVKEVGVKSRKAVGALPEEQISTHVVEMPLMSDEEVRQALQWQVEQYIPIPAEKAVWSHQVIRKDSAIGGMEVLLVAAAKSLVGAYNQILETAGMEVVALETELMATARAVVTPDMPLCLVVDIGARSTDLGIVRNGQLMFSRTIPTAGEAFTRAIETSLGLDTVQAEQYKNAYGFLQNKLAGKLVEAMRPVLTIIAGEIRKTADFYITKHAGEAVKIIVLTGGVAVLPEVVAMLSGLVGIEVVVGNPFNRVSLDANQAKALAGSAPFYTVATGLAMRGNL